MILLFIAAMVAGTPDLSQIPLGNIERIECVAIKRFKIAHGDLHVRADEAGLRRRGAARPRPLQGTPPRGLAGAALQSLEQWRG